MFENKICATIENESAGSNDPLSFPYVVLFKSIGVEPSYAHTIIPFLNRDRDYLAIPGNILRINDLGGGLRDLDNQEVEQEILKYQSTLPEVPLLAMDLRYGFPPDFGHQFGESDLFIVNHGIILSALDIQNPSSPYAYLSSIANAARVNSLLMMFESEYETQLTPTVMAEVIGASEFDDSLNSNCAKLLVSSGIRPRKLRQPHPDGKSHVGDFIKLPESHKNDKIIFFTKN